jgi:hypothetical protein
MMPSVKCPSCGEKGPISRELVGARIKCKKCGASFQIAAPAAKAPVAAAVGQPAAEAAVSRGDTIEVAGLDDSAWSATPIVTAEHAHDHDEEHAHAHTHEEPPSAFTAVHHPEHSSVPDRKQYKLLTQKDKFFEGKFDIARLEDALNHYSSHGWVVRSMVTPHLAGFSGGPKEEIVVLLER